MIQVVPAELPTTPITITSTVTTHTQRFDNPTSGSGVHPGKVRNIFCTFNGLTNIHDYVPICI
jgi:hypothetical protein